MGIINSLWGLVAQSLMGALGVVIPFQNGTRIVCHEGEHQDDATPIGGFLSFVCVWFTVGAIKAASPATLLTDRLFGLRPVLGAA